MNWYLLGQLIKRDVLLRYRGAMFGVLWILLSPLLMLAILALVFGQVFQARWPEQHGGAPFWLVLYSGLIAFNVFGDTVSRAPMAVRSYPNFVKKMIFPVGILPIVPLGTALVHASFNLAIMLSALAWTGRLHAEALLYPIMLVPLMLSAMGLSWFLAAWGVFIKDMTQIVPPFVQMLMFVSPVFYPATATPEVFRPLYRYNPLGTVVEACRSAIFGFCPSIGRRGVLRCSGVSRQPVGVGYSSDAVARSLRMRSDDAVIVVDNLSKTYRLFKHPGDRVKEFLTLGLKRYHHDFVALRDVSFEIKRGETVGIIGRNGAGKSTLLQLVCGVVKPTTGSVRVHGRISALLELGTGFNADFTGRENVFFQGAVMGFTRSEMEKRLEEIMEFADIGEYVDQPVRTYSSGMFLRLAFAVAVHVDPEILVVDEALSTGDAAFQDKCLRRMEVIRSGGCTILFVSHAAGQIARFCKRALLLDHGQLCSPMARSLKLCHSI